MDPADIIKALLPPLLHVLPDAITSHHPNTCEYSHPMNKNKTKQNTNQFNKKKYARDNTSERPFLRRVFNMKSRANANGGEGSNG